MIRTVEKTFLDHITALLVHIYIGRVGLSQPSHDTCTPSHRTANVQGVPTCGGTTPARLASKALDLKLLGKMPTLGFTLSLIPITCFFMKLNLSSW